MRHILPIAVSVLFLLAGCSSAINSVLYSSLKENVPNTEVYYEQSNQQLHWQLNTSQEQQLDVSAHDWHVIHSGSSKGWQWQFVSFEQQTLLAQEQAEWDSLFTRFIAASSELLPQLTTVQLTLYLPKGVKQQIHLTTPYSPDRLEVPYFHWGDNENASLPKAFSERIDLLADLGASLQQAYFASGGLPQPSDSEAAQLKKHANSACWRLAVRPVLALNTKQVLKTPPAAFLSIGNMAKDIYQANQTDVEAQIFYANVLLITAADHYMTKVDLNWPVQGSDTTEISALMDFCKSYVSLSKDPR